MGVRGQATNIPRGGRIPVRLLSGTMLDATTGLLRPLKLRISGDRGLVPPDPTLAYPMGSANNNGDGCGLYLGYPRETGV